MRKKIFFGWLILFVFFLPSYLAAKKYDLDDFRIRAEVQPSISSWWKSHGGCYSRAGVRTMFR